MNQVLDQLRRRFFGTIPNTLLTLVMLAVFSWFVPQLVKWAVVDAVWSAGQPEICRQASGACWAFVHEKYRLILFGRYPYEQQWRPMLVLAIVAGLALANVSLAIRARPMIAMWAIGMALAVLLMRGGIGSLPYIPTDLWGGLPLTVLLAVCGVGVAFPVAILLALGRRSKLPAVRSICIAYIELIRGVPLVSLLFLASFMIPLFLPAKIQIDAVLRALVAIAMFSAAYLAEAIRGGLQAVPRGQEEAAEALGLKRWEINFFVVVPQALKHSIPLIANLFIGLFKDTALVGIVGLTDLLLAAKQALADPQWRMFSLEAYLFVSLIYVAFCYAISRYSRALEARLGRGR